jgi:translation initiation factor IF-2
MTESGKQGEKKTLTLNKKPDLKKVGEGDQVRQSFSHGRTKTVAVEVKRKRISHGPESRSGSSGDTRLGHGASGRLTEGELETRLKALQEAKKQQVVEAEERELREKEELARQRQEELLRQQQEEEQRHLEEAQKQPQVEEGRQQGDVKTEEEKQTAEPQEAISIATREFAGSKPPSAKVESSKPEAPKGPVIYRSGKAADDELEDEDGSGRRRGSTVSKTSETKRVAPPPAVTRREAEAPRKLNRNLISRALDDEEVSRGRSLASIKRARQKHKSAQQQTEQIKVIREVIIPDTITVGELANRMAVRGGEVIKALMKLGMMVTINQVIDADTAELLCTEFGHKFKRISDADIEIGLRHEDDPDHLQIPRAPVVTVMGHVDHGKTSLLDALRSTNVVAGEAGGITQHIGAYQVTTASHQKITFIDTPGHAAFSEMRARGANVTDIVILVVAADDGIMEQTIEAINHAKAANVPMIVAINKIDKPDANPDRVRSELLQHGVVLEEFGGEVLSVEVSAKQRLNLDKLEDAILLQAEILNLKANPHRAAEGVIIEAEIDRGRGTVATVLVQRGTLKIGDIFVAGTEWGRVRALVNDKGQKINEAGPSVPVEILGFNGVPSAGDEFFAVEDESRAREVAEFRQRCERDRKVIASARGTMEQMMNRIAAGEARELSVVIKSDVQGSLEAIMASLAKLGNEEVNVRVLHGAVGGINESDVTLARASQGVIIGFNVRANPQARELARKDSIDIRYYSIIYNVIDDIKAIMSGLLAPTLKEKYLGVAQIREVFTISKFGKIAGCYVTEGQVKRGSKVRLLRDDVVIHEGTLKSLRRFKDEVKEVRESYECGMAFENYNDIRVGDVIECFEMEEIARQL